MSELKTYSGPFSKDYWVSAASELKSVKMLALAALFVAARIALQAFYIPVGENLKIYFTFFITALGSAIYGPIFGLITGFATDILGFFIFPQSGPFFIGYTISTMLGAFVYALFLYRSRITVLKLFFSKLCVNLFVNVGLGSLWSAILYGKGYYYYLAKSAVKNATLLPFETIVLVLFFQLMIPIAESYSLLPKQPSRNIPIV